MSNIQTGGRFFLLVMLNICYSTSYQLGLTTWTVCHQNKKKSPSVFEQTILPIPYSKLRDKIIWQISSKYSYYLGETTVYKRIYSMDSVSAEVCLAVEIPQSCSLDILPCSYSRHGPNRAPSTFPQVFVKSNGKLMCWTLLIRHYTM